MFPGREVPQNNRFSSHIFAFLLKKVDVVSTYLSLSIYICSFLVFSPLVHCDKVLHCCGKHKKAFNIETKAFNSLPSSTHTTKHRRFFFCWLHESLYVSLYVVNLSSFAKRDIISYGFFSFPSAFINFISSSASRSWRRHTSTFNFFLNSTFVFSPFCFVLFERRNVFHTFLASNVVVFR